MHLNVTQACSHDTAFNQLQQDLSVLLLEPLELSNGPCQQDEVLSGVLRVCLDPVLQVAGGVDEESLQYSSYVYHYDRHIP